MASEPPAKPPVVEVERAAKAMYLSLVRSAQAKIAAKALPIEKIKTVFEDAIEASDREAAIVIFALIDDIATEFFPRTIDGCCSERRRRGVLFSKWSAWE